MTSSVSRSTHALSCTNINLWGRDYGWPYFTAGKKKNGSEQGYVIFPQAEQWGSHGAKITQKRLTLEPVIKTLHWFWGFGGNFNSFNNGSHVLKHIYKCCIKQFKTMTTLFPLRWIDEKNLSICFSWDFSGYLVVNTPCFHC